MINCGFPIEVPLVRSDASTENIRGVLAYAQFINSPPECLTRQFILPENLPR